MLPSQIPQLLKQGKTTQALNELREYLSRNQENISAETWHQASVLEEQYGDWNLAGQAHKICIDLAGNNPIALLYAGHWLEKSGEDEGAAALYSLCQDLNSAFIGLSNNSGQAENTIKRSQSANQHLRRFLSQQHRSSLEQDEYSRIKNAIWMRTHDQAIEFSKDYAPALFWVSDLNQRAFYPDSLFCWAKELLLEAQNIKQELENFLARDLSQDFVRPYLQGLPTDYQNLSELVNSTNWSAIDLYKDGQAQDEITAAFPKTNATLEKIPCYKLGDVPFEAFFSILKAGQVIQPHYGQSNHSLTVHLPILIPGDGFLEVNGEKRSWSEDELIIFDDNFLHSAVNKSDKDRIVLIFSIWHPNLTKNEQIAIQTAFKVRARWLENRWHIVTNSFNEALPSAN